MLSNIDATRPFDEPCFSGSTGSTARATALPARLRVLWALLLIGMSSLGLAGPAFSAEGARPNIVLIFTDDQGMHDVGCYGSEIATPHIDSLARDGLKFTSWYVASSICTPSRYGLLTGRYPSRSQDRLIDALMSLGENDANRGLQPREEIFPQLLQQAGYRTALVGKWHLGHGGPGFLPTRHGFDSFVGHTAGCVDYFTMHYGIKRDWYRNEQLADAAGYATDEITDEAVAFLQSAARQKDKPFYLHLAYNAPHFGKGWDAEKQETVNILQPREQELRRVATIKDRKRREFAAMVVALDDGIGRVLAALDKTGLAENTLVIFMTDHGGDPNYGGSNVPFRGGKRTMFEGGLRVPCLMRWPGHIKAGSTSDSVAGAIDLFPTFAAIAGAKTEGRALDGRNILPILQGEAGPEREMLFEIPNETALRLGDWKYVRIGDEEMLFQLANDPYEKENLAERQPAKLQQLKARHDRLMAQSVLKRP